ncbi:hypothetical protein BKA70DRAFT_1104649 [Coprinopsis sp. MPI-PUGE-AT-0042]|nr:hypothetical protein BKA70DRAFT_1104649 [Coprinopsis sp. MPI-PUGE-AT-0042]
MSFASPLPDHNHTDSYFAKLPTEVVSIIAECVHQSIGLEPDPFHFWRRSNPLAMKESTIVACCFVSKQFYAHFRQYLYCRLYIETVSKDRLGSQYKGETIRCTFYLRKVYELLERDPQIAKWVREIRVFLVDEFGTSLFSRGLTEPVARTDWRQWAANDKFLPSILSKTTKLEVFHFFVSETPFLAWEDCSPPLQQALIDTLRRPTLTQINVRSVAIPSYLLVSSPSLKILDQWYALSPPGFNIAPNRKMVKIKDEDLPRLLSFESDDPDTGVGDQLITAYPQAFSQLKKLRLSGYLSRTEKIQPFLEIPCECLKDVQIILGDLWTAGAIAVPPKIMSFPSLPSLKKLQMSMHALPTHLPQGHLSFLPDSLASLVQQPQPSLKSLSVALSFQCMAWNPAMNANAPVSPDISALFSLLDAKLDPLRSKELFPKTKEVTIRAACSCSFLDCRVHEELVRIKEDSKSVLPNLSSAEMLDITLLHTSRRQRQPLTFNE